MSEMSRQGWLEQDFRRVGEKSCKLVRKRLLPHVHEDHETLVVISYFLGTCCSLVKRTSNKRSPLGDAGTIDTGGAGMGGVAGILGTDAAATIFLLKSVYAFLAPLSFALALPPQAACVHSTLER